MTLTKFIENLQKLQAEGHGDKEVFYRQGASGDCGPFDLDEGQEYVSIYAGN